MPDFRLRQYRFPYIRENHLRYRHDSDRQRWALMRGPRRVCFAHEFSRHIPEEPPQQWEDGFREDLSFLLVFDLLNYRLRYRRYDRGLIVHEHRQPEPMDVRKLVGVDPARGPG